MESIGVSLVTYPFATYGRYVIGPQRPRCISTPVSKDSSQCDDDYLSSPRGINKIICDQGITEDAASFLLTGRERVLFFDLIYQY
ncbi:MAG: hypothetical protein MK188_12840 [Gammaproteobacteria bacterium]|nr:hypothetical protein [Gammaproteobacteria bacterium]